MSTDSVCAPGLPPVASALQYCDRLCDQSGSRLTLTFQIMNLDFAGPTQTLCINGNEFEQVHPFRFLESSILPDRQARDTTTNRISHPRDCLVHLKHLLLSRTVIRFQTSVILCTCVNQVNPTICPQNRAPEHDGTSGVVQMSDGHNIARSLTTLVPISPNWVGTFDFDACNGWSYPT